jgi:hypothetical protein
MNTGTHAGAMQMTIFALLIMGAALAVLIWMVEGR